MSADVTAQVCGLCHYRHPASIDEIDEEIRPRVVMAHEEAMAWQRFRSAVADVVEAVESYPYLWNIGDGCGGKVFDEITAAFRFAGYSTERSEPPFRSTKKQLPAKLRAVVLARDGLRCVHCGCEDIDELGVDHIVAEVNGGPHTLDNLQTLCRSCNSRKGTK